MTETSSGPDELTVEDLAGQYVAGSGGTGGQPLGAFEITTFINGEVTDWIARGRNSISPCSTTAIQPADCSSPAETKTVEISI